MSAWALETGRPGFDAHLCHLFTCDLRQAFEPVSCHWYIGCDNVRSKRDSTCEAVTTVLGVKHKVLAVYVLPYISVLGNSTTLSAHLCL